MLDRTKVFVYAHDPVSQAGVASCLRGRPEVELVDAAAVDVARVAIVVADEADEETTRVCKALQRNGVPRVVLVVTRIDDAGICGAVEAGASGILRRSEASPERLVASVRAADKGDGTVAPDLLGRLLGQMTRLQQQVLSPRGLTLHGLAQREIDVLKLVADGMDTAEIARSLCYSERTVKNVIHDVTTRLQLRNRCHAVAYAVRAGLI